MTQRRRRCSKRNQRLEDFSSLIPPEEEEVAKLLKETTKRTNWRRVRKVKFPEIYFLHSNSKIIVRYCS
jgi:hypothetical protein